WIETGAGQRGLGELPRRPPQGAWIETQGAAPSERAHGVAPRRGAWIETRSDSGEKTVGVCRPPQGGVDRNFAREEQYSVPMVAPRRGAWIETGMGAPWGAP